MPKTTVVAEEEYRLPSDVLFTARLESVKERRTQFTYQAHHKTVVNGRARVGEAGEVVKWMWEFKITSGQYADEKVWAETDPKITNLADDQVRHWAETLLGRELEIGEEFDTDLVVGLACQFTVRHEDPRPKKDGSGNFYGVSVQDLFPAPSEYDEPPF